MINILVDDIVPIIVIMALGYICGKFSYFDDDQRQGLNKLVLNIALPAALFVSIIKSTRAMLAKDATLTAISFIGVIVMFMVSYYLCRLGLRVKMCVWLGVSRGVRFGLFECRLSGCSRCR